MINIEIDLESDDIKLPVYLEEMSFEPIQTPNRTDKMWSEQNSDQYQVNGIWNLFYFRFWPLPYVWRYDISKRL